MDYDAGRVLVVKHPELKDAEIRIDFIGDGDCTLEMEDYDENGKRYRSNVYLDKENVLKLIEYLTEALNY